MNCLILIKIFSTAGENDGIRLDLSNEKQKWMIGTEYFFKR